MKNEDLVLAVTKLAPAAKPREKADRVAFTVTPDALKGFMRKLHDDPKLSFDMLCTHTAIDLIAENRFELVYMLYSTVNKHYMMVTTSVPRDNPEISSVSSIWGIAEWQEREAYDLMGILYSDHPDLRRVFLEDDWKGFPLRKDYKDDFMLESPK